MLHLRPFQKAALAALENPNRTHNHVLCIAPTGAGKSLIYEKAAESRGRKTLLVTPLVALARQQFEKLQRKGIPVSLGAGGSSQGPPSSETGAWIISPEMLNYASNLGLLKQWKPNFLVVDECHCLWEWGEQFRPAFSLIPELLNSLAILKSVWLTATLPYEARLHLRKLIPQPLIEMGHFDLPPRLQLSIQQVKWENRTQKLLQWIQRLEGDGIIFVPTRESTLRIGRLTQALGKNTMIYHGGMSSEERINAEQLILNKIPNTIVATSAFGMGMDYSHLKYVILWQAPTSILSLVQTIGRVGRSEEHGGTAIVLWDHEDFKLLEWTIAGSSRRQKELVDLVDFLNKSTCRRAELIRYFDKTIEPNNCGLCDFCINSIYKLQHLNQERTMLSC